MGRQLLRQVVRTIDTYTNGIRARPVSTPVTPQEIRSALARFDFTSPVEAGDAIRFVGQAMTRWQAHALHPRHFGLFVPGTTPIGIAADALVAAFNPALGAWELSPAAVEIERHVVLSFARLFGFENGNGTLTTGGAEANHTAMLCALTRRFPRFSSDGLRALDARPRIYVSSQAHHSLLKAASACGLGGSAVRIIAVHDDWRMNVSDLDARMEADRRAGDIPFFVCATIGTTSTGAIDSINAISSVAARHRAWLHVDAAWGGAGILLPELREHYRGVDSADSITFDPHKWLSVPMCAGVLLTREEQALDRTFNISASYMPPARPDTADPFARSLQWSRRFTGLKVFLSLAVRGWDEYATEIRKEVRLGERLRRALAANGWKIHNRTPLPIVCFSDVDASSPQIVEDIKASGKAWISIVRLGESDAIRACVTSRLTEEEDIDALVDLVNEARGHRR